MMLVHQKMTGHFLVGEWKIAKGRAVGISPREIVEDSFNLFSILLYKPKEKPETKFFLAPIEKLEIGETTGAYSIKLRSFVLKYLASAGYLRQDVNFKNAPKGTNALIALMFVLFAAGIGLIILAKV